MGKYLLVLIVLLSGCANYTYKKTTVEGTQCEVTTRSSREVESAAIYVGENCEMFSFATGLTEDQSEILGEVVKKLPALGGNLLH